MPRFVQRILGPRVPDEVKRHSPIRFGTPGMMLLIARVLILTSLFLPYWHMQLHAPQYPENLQLTAYVNHLQGDVVEIDGLNHYIGMRPLGEAAQIEREYGVFVLILLVVLMELAAYIHSKWAALLVVPAALFPAVFLVDLYLWMRHFGLNLDPHAPLSSAIEPFVPPVLGTGVIGQFKTVASPGVGLIMATVAAVIMLAALFFHRRAYLPLMRDTKQKGEL